jgi:predicted metal-dependent hydrolase
MHQITVSGIAVDIVRKPIKNLYLGVYPPNGRVRVAAPLAVSDSAVRLAVIGKLGWIKRQRARFEGQPRQSKREMVNGESHYFMGQRYRLRIVEQNAPTRFVLRSRKSMDLYVRPGTTAEQRERVLRQWYREKLKELIPPLIQKWQKILGVKVADWGIKKMKTKWGSCNRKVGRIWLNLELAKKPVQCLEYIIVHEMVHLLERHHNERFTALIEGLMPQWRLYRDELNGSELSNEIWSSLR